MPPSYDLLYSLSTEVKDKVEIRQNVVYDEAKCSEQIPPQDLLKSHRKGSKLCL